MSNSSIFGLFDGHGPYGHQISNLVKKLIFNNIIKTPNWKLEPN